MKIQINESQFKRIFEAMRDGFDYEVLKGQSFAFKKKYCEEYLGKQIGGGSSRLVYQIDDKWVLKLAKNAKGIAQNEAEYRICTDMYAPDILPQVDDNVSDEDSYEWIVCEFVLPAKKDDFKQCLGVPFEDVAHLCDAIRMNMHREEQRIYQNYTENENATYFFDQLREYAMSFEYSLGDARRIVNWGLANREDGAMPVILDAGLTPEVYDTYYKRF